MGTLSLVLASLLLTPATAAGPSTVALAPIADAYVHASQKSTNFGASSSLSAYGTPDVESFLRFALPATPAGRVLTAASLRLRTTSLSSAGSTDAQQVRVAQDAWVESAVTWNTKPAATGPLLGTLTGATAVSTSYTVALDATALRPLLGAPASLAVLGTGSNSFWFSSRQSTTASFRPVLTLTFDDVSDPNPPTSPAGLAASVVASTVSLSWTASTDDVAVARYDVHRSATGGFTPGTGSLIGSATATGFDDVGRPAGTWYYRVVARDVAGNSSDPSDEATAEVAASTVSTVPVAPTADAYVHGSQKSTNYGSVTSLAAYGSPDLRSFLRFSLPLPPPGQVLVSASLRVQTTTLSSAGSGDVQQVRLADDAWSESTVTWNTRPAVGTAVLGTLPGGSAKATRYDITVDRDALSARLGSALSLAVLGTGTDGFWFFSRESGTVAARPLLTLQFAPGSGDTSPPSAPSDLTATVDARDVTLAWAASGDDVAVTRYDVHRSAVAGFSPDAGTLVGFSSTTGFSDPDRPAGTGYYRVVARDAGGNASQPSEEAVAVVQAPLGATTLMAFGDAVCVPGTAVTASACRHGDVAAVVSAENPDVLVGLGDLQYETGTYAQFTGGWDVTFGAFRSRTLPTLGNHEYLDPAGEGQGYFDYFYGSGVQQGPFGSRQEGYYATSVGAWQFIGLNTECAPDSSNANHYLDGGCAVGSAQYQWLESTLASSTAQCTVVAFHRPRWTTGAHAPYATMSAMWDLMAQSGVDVVLAGHNHVTEVFKPIGVSGTSSSPVLDPAGIRSFVVGTGGKGLSSFASGSNGVTAALQARDSSTFGALRLTLRDGSFDWSFRPVAGKTYTGVGTTGAFSGTGESCH